MLQLFKNISEFLKIECTDTLKKEEKGRIHMIRRLEVKELNNRLSRPFEFHEDLNIFTGANGSGKTTLLKLIWYLISGNLERIRREIPFQSVSIYTDQFSLYITCDKPDKVSFECEFVEREKNSLKITSIDQETETHARPLDKVSLSMVVDPETGCIEQHEGIVKLDELNELNEQIARKMSSSLFFPTFRRIEGGVSSSQVIISSLKEVMHPDQDRTMENLQEAISELSSAISVFDHKFITSISTNDIARLLEKEYSNISDESNRLHSKLSNKITQKIRSYSVKKKETETQELQEAKSLLDDIQTRLNDVDKEIEELSQPVSVLSKRVHDFFKAHGIQITEKIILGNDKEVVLNAISGDKLSSGEKQLLSFLCYNAFYNNTPIFIDEPELSLHVDWQRRLFSTLLEQGQSNQFFVATHSPFIYSKYSDKEFLLDEDRGEG